MRQRTIILPLLICMLLQVSLSVSAGTQIYHLRRGEGLADVSKKYHVPLGVLIRLNRSRLPDSKNPDRVFTGMPVIVPVSASASKQAAAAVKKPSPGKLFILKPVAKPAPAPKPLPAKTAATPAAKPAAKPAAPAPAKVPAAPAKALVKAPAAGAQQPVQPAPVPSVKPGAPAKPAGAKPVAATKPSPALLPPAVPAKPPVPAPEAPASPCGGFFAANAPVAYMALALALVLLVVLIVAIVKVWKYLATGETRDTQGPLTLVATRSLDRNGRLYWFRAAGKDLFVTSGGDARILTPEQEQKLIVTAPPSSPTEAVAAAPEPHPKAPASRRPRKTAAVKNGQSGAPAADAPETESSKQ